MKMGKDRGRKGNYKKKNPQKPYKRDSRHSQNNYKKNAQNEGDQSIDASSSSTSNHSPHNNLRENQVGITEYITESVGFTGVVKSRFSDFHVNEIDLDGKVLALDDLNVPKPATELKLSADEIAAEVKDFADVVSPELFAEIAAFAKSPYADHDIQFDVSTLDKERRGQLHKLLKSMGEGKLTSTTINVEAKEGQPEKRLIKVKKLRGGKADNDRRGGWAFPGEFVHFILHKENLDTSEVASTMARRLNIRPSTVNYCGTKDKRAKTTQMFCIKRRTPLQIRTAVKALQNVRVGNFNFSDNVLKLGQLKGNRFRIALRHVSGNKAEIENALQQMKERGFINYYGLQRFGNCAEVPTYDVGVALMKKDYKRACELILRPRDKDTAFMKEIREAWWKDRDSTAAVEKFRGDRYIEKKLFQGLAEYGENNYEAALRKIPRNMLLLYPHAVQSLAFNLMASRRIKEFGLQLIPGDLVFHNHNELDVDPTELEIEAAEAGENANDPDDAADIEPKSDENDDQVTELSEDTATVEKSLKDAPASETESAFKRKVHSLTAEDIASGKNTLFDVVLPLPGYDITYPKNVVGEWYEQFLQERGLSSQKMRHNVKTYSMAGAYRKLIIRPENMSWQFRTYERFDSNLIASDWEQLMADKRQPIEPDTGKGKFNALLLDFCLPTSAYATMMLRELLKSDTSAANQALIERGELEKAEEKDATEVEEPKILIKSAVNNNSQEELPKEQPDDKIEPIYDNADLKQAVMPENGNTARGDNEKRKSDQDESTAEIKKYKKTGSVEEEEQNDAESQLKKTARDEK